MKQLMAWLTVPVCIVEFFIALGLAYNPSESPKFQFLFNVMLIASGLQLMINLYFIAFPPTDSGVIALILVVFSISTAWLIGVTAITRFVVYLGLLVAQLLAMICLLRRMKNALGTLA